MHERILAAPGAALVAPFDYLGGLASDFGEYTAREGDRIVRDFVNTELPIINQMGDAYNRVVGNEARDAYQRGYDEGFAAGQRVAAGDRARGESAPMMREARAQAAAMSSAQQEQAARDVASMQRADEQQHTQRMNQRIGTSNAQALARQEAIRQAREEARRRSLIRQSEELGQMEGRATQRYEDQLAREEAERLFQEQQAEAARRRAEEAAAYQKQMAERRAGQAQRRFQDDAEMAAAYEANNRREQDQQMLEILLGTLEAVDGQQAGLLNQSQPSAQGGSANE